MILNTIKESTRGFHNEIESLAYSHKIMNNTLTKDEYKKLLVVNYIFNKNLEDKLLANKLDLLEKIDFNSRLKTDLLEKDLININVDPSTVFKQIDLQDINDKNHSLAYLYLSEGSTLGGNMISKRLKENENLKDIEQFNFYGCYGDTISQKWKLFCETMKSEVSENEEQEVIESANKAFEKYIEIFKSTIL